MCGKLASRPGIHFGEDAMAEKVGVRAALIVLIVVAGVMILVAWFAWSFKARSTVPTSPKPTSRVIVPGDRGAVRS